MYGVSVCSGFVFGLPGLQVLQGSLFVVLEASNVLLVVGLQGSSAPGSPKSARPVLLPTILFSSEGVRIHGWLQQLESLWNK